jgi:YHS domain-containing protein
MNPLQRLALAVPLLLVPGGALAVRLEPATPDAAQEPEKKPRDVSQYNLGKNALALAGFDPVAYFPEGGGRALKGLAEIELVHEGVRYRFASEETRKLFQKKPAKYEPRYGGWCAFAMASGEKVEIDPKSFVVSGDKLFVFYKSLVNETRKKWLKDAAELEKRADAAWAELLRKKQ